MNEKYYTARALRKAFKWMKIPEYLRESYLSFLNAVINHAEPANAKENTSGEWCSSYRTHEFTFQCSNCGLVSYEESNFCPNCGADMRKGETE